MPFTYVELLILLAIPLSYKEMKISCVSQPTSQISMAFKESNQMFWVQHHSHFLFISNDF